MILRISLVFSLIFLISCNGDKPNATLVSPFFYPIEDAPKVMVYRDTVQGMNQVYHKVYTITDSRGEHLIVEIYTEEGRIIEAYNYNTSDFELMDHMVVNAQTKKEKTDLLKTGMFPVDNKQEAYFASRFPGFYDSTFILKEVRRKFSKNSVMDVLDFKNKKTIIFDDFIRQTMFNPFKKTENVLEGQAKSYYVEGIGLAKWHDEKGKHVFVLEEILSEKDWINMINN
ncbi:MAG: hypothetical protein ACI9XP_001568 [Lentimonas sp.]|jgi:hypothetical protein